MRWWLLLACSACYTGAPANRDVRASWVGHARADIIDRWGTPASIGNDGAYGVLQWTHQNTHIELPAGTAAIALSPGRLHAEAAFRPGEIWHTTTEAVAFTDGGGTIAGVEGAALRWGPPNEANIHWGAIFGAHVGLGRLDTTGTPLPSGGAYIGGMLGPTFGLVGTYTFVAGTSGSGSAIGMAGGLAAQWWPNTRLSLRGGPALVLAFDPGFSNAGLKPGVDTGASYAFVKVGRFAVDARFDLVLDTSGGFGCLGVGANLN
jgi:hypothetical protein